MQVKTTTRFYVTRIRIATILKKQETYLQNKNRLIDVENLVITKGDRLGGGGLGWKYSKIGL